MNKKYKDVNGFVEYGRIQVATRLDPEGYDAVKQAAKKLNVSVTHAIRVIVKNWASRAKEKGVIK